MINNKLEIKLSNPPNIDKIKAKFQLHEGVVFCYGSTLYNPNNGQIDDFILCHEEVHCGQQGDNPEEWWDKYLNDKEFRLSQELEAYSAQYQFAKDKQKEGLIKAKTIDKILDKLALTLSSKIYGEILTFGQAKSKIRNYAKKKN